MGRPLDYSIDHFYLVNREHLGLENNTINYLYNSSTMDVYVICEETKMNCATENKVIALILKYPSMEKLLDNVSDEMLIVPLLRSSR